MVARCASCPSSTASGRSRRRRARKASPRPRASSTSRRPPISRMVQLLEQRLGVPLFERKANRLTLTAAGRAYQGGLTPIFDQLANLTAQVTAMAGSRVLTIGVGPTFATRWLIPRLADFQKQEPEIEVRFATGGATVPYNDEWTCGIRLGDGDWPGFRGGAIVRGRSAAGVLAGDGEAPADAGGFAQRHAAARRARRRRMAALVRCGRAAEAAGQGAGVRILRPGAAGGRRRRRRRDGHQPLCRRRPRGGTADRRRSRSRCRRASTGI